METRQHIINELYERHTKLVYYVYSTMLNKSTLVIRNKEDIIQEGMVALWKGCVQYNETMQVKFSTFVINLIYYAMLKYVNKLININKNESALDSNYNDDENKNYTIMDKRQESFDVAAQNYGPEYIEAKILIKQILENFPKRYSVVVVMKSKGHTQQEIANKLGVSQMEISRILNKVKKKIKAYL